jgi:N-acetyl sugar amidotransferase
MNLEKNFYKVKNYRLCSRCVMDTSDPDIEFDNSGLCNNCTGYIERTVKRRYIEGESENTWIHYVEQIKNKSKNRLYDCILGVSGGVDSSYAAILCKRYGLRTLLIHVDNGWNTEVATSNIKSLISILKFDYISKVINWDEFREVQLSFLKAFTVDLEMTTDIAIHASIYEAAQKYGIKYIISGGNLSSEGMLPLTWGYHRYKDMKMYNYIVGKYSNASIKNIPTIGLIKESYYRFFYGIKTLYILNYHYYDKDSAKQELIDQYEWKDYGGKHHESRITAFWQGYVMYKIFGLDYRRPTLSAQICNGITTRSEALEMLNNSPNYSKELELGFSHIATKFKISDSELSEILKNTPKCYKNFPNNKKLIDLCYLIYNRYFNSKRT